MNGITYTNAGVCWNLAVRVAFIGVLPMVATTIVLVSLLSAITTVAAAVAKKATSLSTSRTWLLRALDTGVESCTASGFPPLSRAMDATERIR